MDEYAERHHACSAPFPGIEVALDVLKRRGVRLGLVTGKAARTAAITLERVRIAHYFDVVETGSSAGVSSRRRSAMSSTLGGRTLAAPHTWVMPFPTCRERGPSGSSA